MPIPGRTLIGAGIFVALVGVEVLLARSMGAAPSIRGYVETRTYAVSASAKGIVTKVTVSLGEHVTPGQVIAELDSTAVEAELAAAMGRRKEALSTATTEEALRAADAELEQLAQHRDTLRLRSPTDGVIESIDVRPGDVAATSTPVATIVADDTRRVIACIPESRMSEVDVGRVADITAVVGEHPTSGVVESLTPAVAQLPARCQPAFARIPVLGKQAVIVLDDGRELTPGQTELISFRSEHRAIVAAEPPAAVTAEPQPLDVPPALATVSRLEASGLVWVPALDRYVVVSDETGMDGAHPPWLFTLSQHGVFDPEPLVVEEVKEFDDVESIAADDKAGLFVLASQSVSEKGNRPKAREDLFYVEATHGSFRATKKVKLAPMLDGLVDTNALDIEGMAWRGGALYLGLKAPLDAQGRAMIWKIASPDKLFAGDAAGAGITKWASVALPVSVDGKPAGGGFADLMFLSDTTLVAGATVSGQSAKHQAGVLYAIAIAGDTGTATKLREFPDLRPEGIALEPAGARIAIVFDRGKQVPMWIELPVPEAK